MKTIPYSHQSISKKDIQVVVHALQSDLITQGPFIDEFEKAIAEYVGAKYCVVVNSGTAALHAAYFACGLQSGDELLTTPMTFAATSNAALYLGAVPKFVDIEPETGNIEINTLEKNISKRTKMLAPVHYAGQPVDLKTIKTLAKKYNLKIVEDACHALGASYENSMIGSCKYSDATAFSFHPVKHITTGEGGAITTNNPEIYKQLLLFRTHGITKDKKLLIDKTQGDWYYEMHELGFNYRIPDILAALGISQLTRIDAFVKKRREIAAKYDVAFKNSPFFDIPPHIPNTKHAYHLYPIRLKDKYKEKKKIIFSTLREKGLGVQVHYLPVYQHPYYKEHVVKDLLLHNTEDFYIREVSIPIYQDITNKDIETVIGILNHTFHELS